jgi:PDZ domain/Aspartyl protease
MRTIAKTTRLLTALAGLALLLGAAGAPRDASPSTKSLLDALRKATLERPLASITSLHTAGAIELVGLRGRAQEWDDLRGVRFTSDQNAGALSGASGWDGKVAWNQDYAGLVTIDGGTAGRLQAVDQAYLDNLRYLRRDAGGATIVYAGVRSDGETSYDVLAVTPPHGSEVDLWIDPRTHLIARETATIGINSSTTVLSDYRRVAGISYPFDSSTRTSSGNTFAERISSLDVNTDVAERMRVPRQNVHDFSISGGTSTTVPLQIVNNHVYLSGVTLDGHGPYTFVLDSGGDYIVTPEVAAAVQAKSSGGLQLQGVGSATEGAGFTHINSIAIGNAVVHNQYMLVLPIATGFGVAEGMKIDGMVGYQLLARFLTTIDYANSKLTLAMPSAGPAAMPGAAAISFFIDGTIPRISVSVDGVTASAEVDTGNRAGLELSSPFLAVHPAIAALAKTPAGVVGFGVGGPAYARLGRVPTLQIGPYAITNSVASFTFQTKGAFADPFNPANIGGAIWRRFDVTFDYSHQQMLLAKNAEFDAPFPYDRSGLFLIDTNGAYAVLSVFAGSPGAAAGLAKGDVIVAINGAAASSESLAALRALLSGPAGTVVHLHIRGPAGHERDATLTLADYV